MSEKLEAVATSEAPAALGAYSQAVKANGFVFVSGQLGIDPATGELAGESAGEQAAQALKNIKHILDTAGSGIENVCRVVVFISYVSDAQLVIMFEAPKVLFPALFGIGEFWLADGNNVNFHCL